MVIVPLVAVRVPMFPVVDQRFVAVKFVEEALAIVPFVPQKVGRVA